MRFDNRSYLVRVGDAFSQLLNTLFLNGDPDESISGRCFRSFILKESDYKIWGLTYYLAEFIFWPRDRGKHCELAFYEDMDRWKKREELFYKYVKQESHAKSD